nr:hypothetical protein [Tanacetum cinerariifolium]
LRYVDQNGDGNIDQQDYVRLGNPNPRFTYGLNTTFRYKFIDLQVDIQGVGGVELLNGLREVRYGNENYTKDFYDNRWRGVGTSNTTPSANLTGRNLDVSSYYIEKGDYIRLRNVQIGFNIPKMGQPTSQQFFQTQADATVAVNAPYGKLREWNLTAFNWLSITTLTSDDAEKGSVTGDAEFLNNFTFFRITPTEGAVQGYWDGQYQQINLCNQVIQNVPGINMDATLRSRYVGEAKFLRGLAYFNLVRAYGGVPLLLKVAETADELNPSRATRDEVYTAIIADATDAAAVLPAAYGASDVGRATKGAALTLLAKAQLYQKNYAASLAASDQVLGLGYSLA